MHRIRVEERTVSTFSRRMLSSSFFRFSYRRDCLTAYACYIYGRIKMSRRKVHLYLVSKSTNVPITVFLTLFQSYSRSAIITRSSTIRFQPITALKRHQFPPQHLVCFPSLEKRLVVRINPFSRYYTVGIGNGIAVKLDREAIDGDPARKRPKVENEWPVCLMVLTRSNGSLARTR